MSKYQQIKSILAAALDDDKNSKVKSAQNDYLLI